MNKKKNEEEKVLAYKDVKWLRYIKGNNNKYSIKHH